LSRERDVRNAIRDALVATHAFSGVWLSGLPEDYGQGASELTAAAIEPVATTYTTGWDAQTDGGLDFTATLNVTLLARHEDPQLRDELVEQLLDTLANAVNGVSLASFTLPGKTFVQSWRWQPALAPERRIQASVTYAYIVTWEGFDTSI
jgi:hypothetical protein